MELAGKNLLNALCPTRNYLPYWEMKVDDDYRGRYKFRQSCNAHNIGRWWDTMLKLEDAIGFNIPLEAEGGMLQNLWKYCDNPTGILINFEDSPDDAGKWYIHSFRETMLALTALVNFRNSRQAVATGRIAIEKMAQASANPDQWVFPSAKQPYNDGGPQGTHGRTIEGLVLFYEATGVEEALDLAGRYAKYHLEHSTHSDGSFAGENVKNNHTHSYLNTLRGLFLYGKLTRQHGYVDVVEVTYNNAISKMITPSGFITHDIDVERLPFAVGEVSSAGDTAQLALWLWKHTGKNSYLDDVERIVRARLLPSQITDLPGIKPEKENDDDAYRDLDQRIVGAIGGALDLTFGKSCITDITAAALHSLIDVYNNRVNVDKAGIWVNLHFDYKNRFVSVTSQRDKHAKLIINVPGDKNIFVRIPGWTPAESVVMTVNRKTKPLVKVGDYIFVGNKSGNLKIEIHYELPEHIETEISRCRFYDAPGRIHAPTEKERAYTIKWRGDEVIGASPVRAYFPIYNKI